MSTEFISRIIGMVVGAVGGAFGGIYIADRVAASSPYQYGVLFLLVGALVGLVLTPYITVWPFMALRRRIRQAPAQQILAVVFGLIVGLIIAGLVAFPLSMLPEPYSQILPFVAAILFGYLGITVMITRQRDIFNIVRGRLSGGRDDQGAEDDWHRPVLLDTSVIIDGRIADISRTGFIEGEMLVPRFVLNELQHVADSSDSLRRNRGRRGLEMLRRLQDESITPVRITDMDVEEVREVDDKLVVLGKRLHCPIVTNDYNLNRVAELQGVRVLNINELANAVKALLLPGEPLTVKIVQVGKEVGQGVGYLDDGTMVVVAEGKSHINQRKEVIVTKVLQTAAGRMLFARLA
ncbi:MAG: PIN domain nuclease [Chloroflexi bacterium]|nr:MAG: PIN domain nuclease [Chloroflexota bacterium]RLC85181.1 MAG: PIN domain nuclease [Chloroflexota bacterium]